MARNSSIESREGEVKSPNYPAPYSEGNHFRLHIKVPNASSNSERIIVRFQKIDIEFQEECLYDYIGLQSTESGPMHKICGHYITNLERCIPTLHFFTAQIAIIIFSPFFLNFPKL